MVWPSSAQGRTLRPQAQHARRGPANPRRAAPARPPGRPAPSGRSGGTPAGRRPRSAGVTTTAPAACAAATAPPASIIIVRSRVSPRAGTRGRRTRAAPATRTAAASHGDVHGHDGALVAFEEQVDGQVVEHAAVHQQPAVVGRDRREEHGQPQRSAGCRRGAGPRRCTWRVRLTRSVLTRASCRDNPSMTESPVTPRDRTRARVRRGSSACDGKVQSLKGLRWTNSA